MPTVSEELHLGHVAVALTNRPSTRADEEEDRRRFRDGIRMLVNLENSADLAALIEERITPLDSDLESDEAMNAWMRKDVTTGHHISCTNKMGPATDEMAVVDESGRVRGTLGLRRCGKLIP